MPNSEATAAAGRHVLRAHALPLLLALLFAIVIVGPRWFLLWTEPVEGVRTQISPGGAYGIGWDEALYVPGMREAFEGDLPIRDAYLDGEGAPPLAFALWQEAIGVTAAAAGADSVFGSFAAIATMAALAGLALLYVLGYVLTGNRWVATAAVPVVMLLAQIVYQAGGFLPLRHWDELRPLLLANPPGEFHTWYRFLAPSLPLPIFFGTMLAVRSWAQAQTLLRAALSAVGLALLAYTNPYFSTAAYGGMVLWVGWLLVDGQRQTAVRAGGIAVAGLLLALPEIAIVVWNAADVSPDVPERAGLRDPGLETQWIMSVLQRLVLLAPFAWGAARRDRQWALYTAMATAPLLLALTAGLLPQVDHYLYQAWLPMSVPLFLSGGMGLWQSLSAVWRPRVAWAAAAVAVAAAVWVVAFQARAVMDLDQDYALRAEEAAAMGWIRNHVPEGAIVVSPSRSTNYLLASLTGAKTYVPAGSGSVGTRADDDEIIDRYLRASAAFGYSLADTMYRLDAANGIPRPDRDDEIPPSEIERYVERSMVDYLLNEIVDRPEEVAPRTQQWQQHYEALLADEGALERYSAGFLYCGPRERLWDGAAEFNARIYVVEAFRKDSTRVYSVVSPTAVGATKFEGCNAATG